LTVPCYNVKTAGCKRVIKKLLFSGGPEILKGGGWTTMFQPSRHLLQIHTTKRKTRLIEKN